MYWISLFLAGACEIGWPLGLKLADLPNMKIWGIGIAVISMALSGLLLWYSLKEIPIGTLPSGKKTKHLRPIFSLVEFQEV
ncbi:MAG: hypothetical protein EBY69_06950, partial [Burkholderiaceae bacterium]|nr:hypothetical protein [Burkholderiaceae bacterium]